MRTERGARCTSQIARERRLSAYSGEFGTERDICDVTLWLKEKFRETSLILWVDRHHSQRGREIANVVVITAPKRPISLTPAAREAFLALDYVIQKTGADTYGLPLCEGHHSQHDAIRAYARIEAALRGWRST